MSENQRIPIPYNDAGRLAFDVIRSFAEKIWVAGKQATSDFTITNFPDSRTVSNKFADRKFRRVIETTDGVYITVIYDYMTQTTSWQLPCNEAERGRDCEEVVEAFGNRGGDIAIGVSAS